MSNERPPTTIDLRVLRQEHSKRPETRHWETFRVRLRPRMTLASALHEIECDPVTIEGTAVAPIVWEASCRARSCASCAINVNGHVRMACGSLIEQLSPKGRPLKLSPLQHFPLVRDLLVDRTRMSSAAQRLRTWPSGDQPAHAATASAARAQLEWSRCTHCGACIEACPEARAHGGYLGAAAIAASELSARFGGGADDPERSAALLQAGGVEGCDRSLNCVAVCPEAVPLDDAIAGASRRATRHWLFRR